MKSAVVYIICVCVNICVYIYIYISISLIPFKQKLPYQKGIPQHCRNRTPPSIPPSLPSFLFLLLSPSLPTFSLPPH